MTARLSCYKITLLSRFSISGVSTSSSVDDEWSGGGSPRPIHTRGLALGPRLDIARHEGGGGGWCCDCEMVIVCDMFRTAVPAMAPPYEGQWLALWWPRGSVQVFEGFWNCFGTGLIEMPPPPLTIPQSLNCCWWWPCNEPFLNVQ